MAGNELEPTREEGDSFKFQPWELSGRKESESSDLYLRAVSYETDAPAFEAYSRVQDLVFGSDYDLSAYRIHYKQVPHVVVLGIRPPQEFDRKVTEYLKDGKSAKLPADIIEFLTQRRAQARRIGPWVEGHYRPGRLM